jgi:drug/metabolite transporter (DMT)-like permease
MFETSSENRGRAEVVLASLAFGFLGIFGRLAFRNGVSVGEVLTFRFTLASLFLWAWLFFFRRRLIAVSKKQLFIAALLGIFGYAFFSTLYFEAIKGISVALAALLLYTYPLWVTLLSALFKLETISVKDWLTLGVASAGLGLVLWGNVEASSLVSLACGLGAGLFYALYILASSRFQRDIKPITSTLYVISFCTLALALFHRPDFMRFTALSGEALAAVSGLTIVCTIIPLTLILAGLQKLKSSEAALITMIEPVTAVVMAGIIFGERMNVLQGIGACLILSSLSAKALKTRKYRN